MISNTLNKCLLLKKSTTRQPFKHQGKERIEFAGNYLHDHGARMAHNNFGAPQTNKRSHGGVDINYTIGGNGDLGAPVYATHDD